MPGALRLSVVIPTYNCAHYLADAIESVIAQTNPVHEIIVVDDGSTDDTEKALLPYRDRITFLRQENRGAGIARNNGIEHASGDWVAFLDADDVWKPDKLTRQVEAIDDDRRLVCVHTNFFTFGDRQTVNVPFPAFVERRHDAKTLLSGAAWVSPSSALVKRTARSRFREWAPQAEDVIYFCDLTFEGSFRYLAEPLVGQRIHPRQTSQRPDSTLRGTLAELKWVREMDAPLEVRSELENVFFTSVASAVDRAKSQGQWRFYWQWRSWLRQQWPAHIPRAAVLDEALSPVFVYRTAVRVIRRLGTAFRS